ncbi:MAG: hypothetical protein J6C86_01550 [Bacteroidaceae bacterium]|nr:hypothetical protein [Bacteroidaceae bacterium]
MRKSLFLFLALFCLFFCMSEAQIRPLIEKGKSWHVRTYGPYSLVFGIYNEGPDEEYDLCFMEDADTVINGRTYMKLTYQNGHYFIPFHKDGAVYAILREEDGKVYAWNKAYGREILLYDFTLNEGDEFELQSFCDTGTYSCKVEEVSYIEANGIRLKNILFSSIYSELSPEEIEEHPVYTTWTECLGGVMPQTHPDESTLLMDGGAYEQVSYITYSDGGYIPARYDGHYLHGQQLVLGKEVTSEIPEDRRGHDDLKYEFVDEHTLHVYGTMWTKRNPNQYIYLTGVQVDVSPCPTFEFKFEVDELEPHVEGEGAYTVDLYFGGFGPLFLGSVYRFTDSEGVHVVEFNREQVLGIDERHVEEARVDERIFNLSGCVIKNVPKKGIYIKGGKKYMVR